MAFWVLDWGTQTPLFPCSLFDPTLYLVSLRKSWGWVSALWVPNFGNTHFERDGDSVSLADVWYCIVVGLWGVATTNVVFLGFGRHTWSQMIRYNQFPSFLNCFILALDKLQKSLTCHESSYAYLHMSKSQGYIGIGGRKSYTSGSTEKGRPDSSLDSTQRLKAQMCISSVVRAPGSDSRRWKSAKSRGPDSMRFCCTTALAKDSSTVGICTRLSTVAVLGLIGALVRFSS